jgi:hypothetical protein
MSLPKGRSLPGWGAAETPYEGMRFRKEILRTVDAMRALHPILLNRRRY